MQHDSESKMCLFNVPVRAIWPYHLMCIAQASVNLRTGTWCHAPCSVLNMSSCTGEESSMSRPYSASRGSAGIAAVQQNDECPQPGDWDPSYR